MKRKYAVLAAMGIVLAATTGSQAQDVPVPAEQTKEAKANPQPQPVPPSVEAVPGGGGLAIAGRGGKLLSDAGLEKLALTKEQKAKFDKLNEEYQKKQKDLQFPGIDVLKSPDPKKIRDHIDAQRKLRPDYLAKVESILTDEQKKIFDEVRRERQGNFGPGFPGLPFGNFQPPAFGGFGPGKFLSRDLQERLKLSDEQRKKVDELQKELEASVLKLLSDEQKKSLAELKKRGPGGFGFAPPIQFQPPNFQPPAGGGDPAVQEQLQRLIRELEALRKEVKDIKKGQK
ncbi:MAG: hypothetical protein HYX68_28430 [Planctomycetes bacterium]|nr:hypothetical protein [Planctomycetota bacterium]